MNTEIVSDILRTKVKSFISINAFNEIRKTVGSKNNMMLPAKWFFL